MSASCCGSDRKTAALILVSALLMIAVIGWVREANKEPRIVQQPVEMVEVLVAAKDLTTGTAFTKANVDELTHFAFVPRSSLAPESKRIKTKDELIGKRLNRATHEGETFEVPDVHAGSGCMLFDPKDLMSLPAFKQTKRGLWVPGSRGDVMASCTIGENREVVTLLPDMKVLAVEDMEDERGNGPDMVRVSFAVDERQLELVIFANKHNFNLEIVMRPPGSPKSEFDYDKTLALLEALVAKLEEPKLEVAPPPRVKSVS